MTKRWPVVLALMLWLLFYILGDLLDWEIPQWAGFIDLFIGCLILYWAYKMYPAFMNEDKKHR